MTSDEQLRRWVAGELDGMGKAAHLDPMQGEKEGDGDCCPDFACCVPAVAASAFERQAFADAYSSKRIAMLGLFMSRMLAHKL